MLVCWWPRNHKYTSWEHQCVIGDNLHFSATRNLETNTPISTKFINVVSPSHLTLHIKLQEFSSSSLQDTCLESLSKFLLHNK